MDKKNLQWSSVQFRKPHIGLGEISCYQHFVVIPTGTIYHAWESIFAVALLYTLLVLPVETAFWVTDDLFKLFVINRIVDVVFFVHIVLSCFLSYETTSTYFKRTVWEMRLSEILKRYLCGPFAADVIFYAASGTDIVQSSDVFHFYAARDHKLRLWRLLRLLGLPKLFVHRDKMHSWIWRVLAFFRVPREVAAFVTGLLGLFIAAHFMACIWGLTALVVEESEGDSMMSWVGALESQNSVKFHREDAASLYCVSFYWAMCTLTTVGYGDVVAMNAPEYIVCSCLILAGACAWSRFFGVIFNAVNGEDDDSNLHNQLTIIAAFSKKYGVTPDLEARLCAHLGHQANEASLLSRAQALVAPSLQEEILQEVYGAKLQSLSFFSDASKPLIWQLTMALTPLCFDPAEIVVPPKLKPYVCAAATLQHSASPAASSKPQHNQRTEKALKQGCWLNEPKALPLTILDDGLVVMKLSVNWQQWHQDFLVARPDLQEPVVARALSFTTVFMLTRESVMTAIDECGDPASSRSIRRQAARTSLRRALRLAGESSADGTRSFRESLQALVGDESPANEEIGPIVIRKLDPVDVSRGREGAYFSTFEQIVKMDGKLSSVSLRLDKHEEKLTQVTELLSKVSDQLAKLRDV